MSDTTPAELGTDFVEVTDSRTGFVQNVPRDFLDHPVLSRFIEPTAAQRERDGIAAVPVEEQPTPDGQPVDLTGRPTEDWKAAQIEEYADAASIDLAGHKASKAAMVARINEVLDTPPPAPDPDLDTNSPDGNPPAADTPPAGDTQE